MILRKIDYMSCARVVGGIYALVGLLCGAFFSLVALAGLAVAVHNGSGIPAVFLGAGAVIVLPVIYGLMGSLVGLVTAAVYNLVASVVGGIELDIDRPGHASTPPLEVV